MQAALADVVTQEDLQDALADAINSNNLYYRVGNIVTTGNALATITSTASCDFGDIVLEGGYNINNFGGGPIHNLVSSPSITGDAYSTTVRVDGVTVQSNAVCFDTP